MRVYKGLTAGIRLLYTRSEQGDVTDFTDAFQQGGGILYALPTLTLTPLYSKPALDKIVSQLPNNTVCIFVSRTAIAILREHLPKAPTWPNVTCICMGPGSAQDLMAAGIAHQHIILPLCPPYDTENLLKHPFFLDRSLETLTANPRSFVIFRGPPGRDLLAETLRASGAFVTEIALYERTLPTLTPNAEQAWQSALTNHNVTLVSSGEGLNNLCTINHQHGASHSHRLYQQPLIVPSQRVANLAKNYDFRYIIETGNLVTKGLLDALGTISQQPYFFGPA